MSLQYNAAITKIIGIFKKMCSDFYMARTWLQTEHIFPFFVTLLPEPLVDCSLKFAPNQILDL